MYFFANRDSYIVLACCVGYLNFHLSVTQFKKVSEVVTLTINRNVVCMVDYLHVVYAMPIYFSPVLEKIKTLNQG